MRKLQNKITGFTLVELIITLLIGSLLLAWGVPNYRDLKVRRQVTDTANEMSYSLSLARAEAIRYGRTVTVAPVDGGWNSGWSIFTTGIEGGDDIQIYAQDSINNQLDIAQNGELQGNLQFNNVGELVGIDEGLFSLTHTSSGEKRNINVKLSGSVRVVKP